MHRLFLIISISVLMACSANFVAGIQRVSANRSEASLTDVSAKELYISPEIASLDPAPGDSAVPVSKKIYIFFKQKGKMMERTGDTVIVVRDQQFNIVPGNVSFGKNAVAFYPSNHKWQPGQNYRVTVQNVRYRGGAKLVGSKSWVFTTAE